MAAPMASVNGYRVVCDLSDLISDFRRKSFIYIDLSKDRVISDLTGRIKSVIGLDDQSNILLGVGDCFLPATEDVRVLHEGDILKVIKHGNNEPSFEVGHAERELSKKKRKEKSKIRKKKKKMDLDAIKTEPSVPEIVLNTNVTEDTTIQIVKDATHQVVIVPAASVNDSAKLPAPEDCNLKGPRKRKRIRQRKYRGKKRKDDFAKSHEGEIEKASCKPQVLWSINKPVSSNDSSKSQHLRFSDDCYDFGNDHINNVSGVKTVPPEPQNKPVITVDSVPASVNQHEDDVDQSLIQPKASQWDAKLPTLSNNQEGIGNGHEPIENDSNNEGHQFSKLLALRNSTPIVVKRVKQCKSPDKEVDLDTNTTTPLQGLPKNNDILSFKILRMDESYSPRVSNPITARVVDFSEATMQITLDILDGRDQCDQPRGKFDIETDENEQTVDTQSSVIQLNWGEVMEPCRKML